MGIERTLSIVGAVALFAPSVVYARQNDQQGIKYVDCIPLSEQEGHGTLRPLTGGEDRQQNVPTSSAPYVPVNFSRGELPVPENVHLDVIGQVEHVFSNKGIRLGTKVGNVQQIAKVGMSELQKGLKGEAVKVAKKIRLILEKILYKFVEDEDSFKYLTGIVSAKGFEGVLDSEKEIRRILGENPDDFFDELRKEKNRLDEIARVSVPMRAHVQKRVVPVASIRSAVLNGLSEIVRLIEEISMLEESLKVEQSVKVVAQINGLKEKLADAREFVDGFLGEFDGIGSSGISFKDEMLGKSGYEVPKVVAKMGRMLRSVINGSRVYLEREGDYVDVAGIRSRVASAMKRSYNLDRSCLASDDYLERDISGGEYALGQPEAAFDVEAYFESCRHRDKKYAALSRLSQKSQRVLNILNMARREQGLYSGESRAGERRRWRNSVVKELAQVAGIELRSENGYIYDSELFWSEAFPAFKKDFDLWINMPSKKSIEFKLPRFLI